jgi:alanine racemase
MAYITLNKQHFFTNLDIIAKLTKSKDKIALVLKDNAYGHGLCEVAKLAKEYGITKAIVQLEKEAIQIEDFFEYVLILADTPKTPTEKFFYTINELDMICKFPKNTQVELKVNTGMNRNGIEMHQLEEALKLIQAHELHLRAIFTHHGCADEINGHYEMQKKNFENLKKDAHQLLKDLQMEDVSYHSANSATLFREKSCSEDMARVGIAAYGTLELPFASQATQLKAILSVYAKRLSTRNVKKGSCIGYGASFQTQEECVVSTYDFGYGSGFLRSCSNNYKTPQGVEIVGRISMDNSSFLSQEDELLIFNDARNLAKYADTISYEVLTSLKAHLKRKII